MKDNKLRNQIAVPVPTHIYNLFQCIMKHFGNTQHYTLREMIKCAIVDFFGENPDFDFSKSTPEMMGHRVDKRLRTMIDDETLEMLSKMSKKLCIENQSQLLRRIITIICLDTMLDIEGLGVIKKPDEE